MNNDDIFGIPQKNGLLLYRVFIHLYWESVQTQYFFQSTSVVSDNLI